MGVKSILKDALFGTLVPWTVLVYTYDRQHGYFAERYDVLLMSAFAVYLIAVVLRSFGVKGLLIFNLWIAILLPSCCHSRILDCVLRLLFLYLGFSLLKKVQRKYLSFLLSMICVVNALSICRRDVTSRVKAKHLTESRQLRSFIPPKENIYWFVLDAYTSLENLKNYYHFDNTNFYKSLVDLGFVTRDGSLPYRKINMFPTLKALNFYTNFNHFNVTQTNVLTLHFCLKHNRLFNTLLENGYRVYATDSRFPFLHMLPTQALSSSYKGIFLQFVYHCCRQNNFLKHSVETALNQQLYRHQNAVFKFLRNEFRPKEKCFYYIHIDSPHAPFVRNGQSEFFNDCRSVIWGENEVGTHGYSFGDYCKAYIEQLKGLNENIISLLDSVLQRDPHALIVLQGDHGTFMTNDEKEQSGFLFAVKGIDKYNQWRPEQFFKHLVYGK